MNAEGWYSMTRPRSWIVLLLLTGAAPAFTPVQIKIRNDTQAPMVCQILAAHWYTPLPIATAVPGADAVLALTFDSSRGQAVDDPIRQLPLEILFCGCPGRAWETRSVLDLRMLAASAVTTGVATGICRIDGNEMNCTPTP